MRDYNKIKELVGEIKESDLDDIDYAVSKNIGLFIPSIGPCKYSISPDHTHPSFMIIITLDDRCKIKIDNKIYNSEKNKIYFYHPDFKHQEIVEDNFSRYYVFMVQKDYLKNEHDFYNSHKIPENGSFFEFNKNIPHLIQTFMREYEKDLTGMDRYLNILGQQIMHEFFRVFYGINSKKTQKSIREEVNTAISYMEDNFSESISIENLANQISISPSHFTRIFKKETSLSPQEYLNVIRLEKARKMLYSKNSTITDIAYKCGFNSSSYFATSFTNRYKLTPSQFQKNIEIK